MEMDDIVFWRVIAQGIKEFARYDICGRCQLREVWRIEFEHVPMFLLIFNNEPWRDSVTLRCDNLPWPIGGRRGIARTALEFGYRHSPLSVPVCVPIAVGDFAKSVDVGSGNGTFLPSVLLLGRNYETVLYEIVQAINLARLYLARGAWRRFAPQRIVRIEFFRPVACGLGISAYSQDCNGQTGQG